MMGTLQLSPNDPPDQNMVNTGGGGVCRQKWHFRYFCGQHKK